MKQLIVNKNWKINKDYNIDKILYLLIDRPNRIDYWNNFIWENNKVQFHRCYDLPSIINIRGHVEWCKNHKSHRNKNKPAIMFYNGKKEYCINGKFIKEKNKMKICCKNKYWEITKQYDIDKILYLLIDRPFHINSNSDFYWFNKKDQFHRDYDLPTLCSTNDSYIAWYKNNKCHRENNKPARIFYNGYKEYYINNNFIKIIK